MGAHMLAKLLLGIRDIRKLGIHWHFMTSARLQQPVRCIAEFHTDGRARAQLRPQTARLRTKSFELVRRNRTQTQKKQKPNVKEYPPRPHEINPPFGPFDGLLSSRPADAWHEAFYLLPASNASVFVS